MAQACFGNALALGFATPNPSASSVPANALLNDDGAPILNDDGSYILVD